MEKNIRLPYGQSYIPCRITEPDGYPVMQVVLGVHGFGGSMNDAIQKGIAEEMLMFNDAVVQFDMPAHGENPAQELTLAECRKTLLTVVEHIWQTYPQAEQLCIFATGFGAYVVLCELETLQTYPAPIRLVVQTPSVMMHTTLLSMLRMSKQTLRAMDRKMLPSPRPLMITYDFYQELEHNIVLTTHRIPMLILHGEADDFIAIGDILNFRRVNEGSKLVFIPGASHRFLEEGAWDMVLDLTRDWFTFQQVLLCDWI